MIFIHLKKRLLMLILLGIAIVFVLFGMIQIRSIYSESAEHDGLIIAGFIPFYWMTLLVGGLIILTLSYVSVRKYIGHRRRLNKKRKRK